MSQQIHFRRVERSDLNDCTSLEQLCYSDQEAATREHIAKRIETYPDGFFVAEANGQIIGMINCGATHMEYITDELYMQLAGHVRNGKHSVIFSLAVHPDYRGRGIAKELINLVIEESRKKQKQSVHLLCKKPQIDFYRHLGFDTARLSSNSYNNSRWYELSLSLSVV